MPSEWAMKSAQGIVRPLKARIYQQMTALDYDDTWNRIAEALDTAHKQGRIEGMAMAAGIAETQRAARIVSRSAEPDYDRIRELTDRAIGAAEVGLVIRARIEELQK